MKVLAGQSIFDLSIQLCGSIEAAYDLAIANGLNITDEPVIDVDVVLVGVNKQEVVSYYDAKGLKPASAISSAKNIFSEEFKNEFQ